MSDSTDLRAAPTLHVDRVSGDAETLAAGAGRKVAAPLKRGDRIGRYVVLEERGRGGMGVVYVAYDPELDRRVALKLLRPRVMGGVRHTDPEARALLLHEAQSAAKLRHPNVTTVHDAGHTDNGSVFLAMEYVDGQDLREWLAETPPWRDVLDAFIAAGRGLEAAHAAGIVHRDFKPGNVMRDASGQVMVTDFGIAQALRRDEPEAEPDVSQKTVTTDGLSPIGEGIVGTPAYMPPEQYKGQPGDERSDVFAYCVSLYEGLYGELPFQGRSLAELMQQVKTGEVEVPKAREVPSWVRRAVLKGLAAKPEDRWVSMMPLLAALSKDPAPRRRRMLTIAGGAVLLVVAGATIGRAGEDPWCQRQLRAVDDTWGAVQRDAVADAFSRMGVNYWEDLWQKAEQQLDGFAKNWSTVAANVCVSTQGMDRRKRIAIQSCLEARRTELSEVLLLLREADQAVLDDAIGLVSQLEEPLSCVDAQRPEDDGGDQVDAATRERRVQVGAKLRQARLQSFVGRLEQAEQLIEAARRQLGEDHSPWLRAQIELDFATTLRRRGDHAAEYETLLEALRLALASGRDRLIARCLIRVSHSEVRVSSDEEAARRWARLAGGALERVGSDPNLEARMHNAIGTAYIHEAAWEPARDAILLAKAASERDPNLSTMLGDAIQNNLGATFAASGDIGRALEVFEAQIASRQERYGPNHPQITTPLSNAGKAYFELGKYAEAHSTASRIVRIISDVRGEDSPELVSPLALLADASSRLGEDAEALGARERAYALAPPDRAAMSNHRFRVAIDLIYQYGYGERPSDALSVAEALVDATWESDDDVRLAEALTARSDARRRSGQFEAALADADEAITVTGRAGSGVFDVADAHYERGLALLALKRPGEALVAFEISIAVTQPEPDDYTPLKIAHRGRALRELGRVDEAIESFEAAIYFAEAHGPRRHSCWARMLLVQLIEASGNDLERAWREAQIVAKTDKSTDEDNCRRDAKQWLDNHDAELRPGSERAKVRAR